MRPKSTFLLLVFLCSGLLCGSKARAGADAVVINGKLTCTVHGGPAGGIFTNVGVSFGYEVNLCSNLWLIKTIYEPGRYELTGFDGTNVYSYLVDGSFVPPSGLSSEAVEELKKLHVGTITAGRLPLEQSVWTMCPWFAFCSGAVLADRKPGDLIPAPWGGVRFNPAASIVFDLETTTFDRPPYLPKECKFRVSELLKSKVLATNLANSTDKEELQLKLEASPAGFLGGEYRVISTTNFAGLEIPLEFECKRFIPSGNSNSWLGYYIKGKVESISSGHLDSTQPPIPEGEQISAIDTRLRALDAGIQGWRYKITNGVWPAEIPVDAIRAFDKGKRNHIISIPASSVTVRRHGAWVVFLLLALIPPVLIFLFRKKF